MGALVLYAVTFYPLKQAKLDAAAQLTASWVQVAPQQFKIDSICPDIQPEKWHPGMCQWFVDYRYQVGSAGFHGRYPITVTDSVRYKESKSLPVIYNPQSPQESRLVGVTPLDQQLRADPALTLVAILAGMLAIALVTPLYPWIPLAFITLATGGVSLGAYAFGDYRVAAMWFGFGLTGLVILVPVWRSFRDRQGQAAVSAAAG